MSDETAGSPRQTFQFGRVFSRAFEGLGKAPLAFLLVSLVLVLAPEIGIAWLVQQANAADASTVKRLLNFLEGLTTTAIANGAIISMALQTMQSGTTSAGRGFAKGFQLWGPVLGISILAGLGSVLAALLFIIPGLFLAVCWSVAIPSRVDGKPGVSLALTNSFEITRGSRWAIFAVWLVALVAFLVVFAVLGVVLALAGVDQNPIVNLITEPLAAWVGTVVTALISASCFEEIKSITGAGSATATADIFN